jgi:hypothetical protein
MYKNKNYNWTSVRILGFTTDEYRSLNVSIFYVFPTDLTFNNPLKYLSFYE